MVNHFKRRLLIGCTSLVLSVSVAATSDSRTEVALANNKLSERPNVIVILADDLGYTDLSAYGSEIQTPNIDRLADQGVKFSNYHTSPSCAPSRAMLLTGVDNHLAGVPNIPEALPPEQRGYENYEGVLSPNVATVASLLHADGYHTYMTGKWHLGKTEELLPFNRGFERTLSMADSGADNWEQRPYSALYDHAHWTQDGKEVQLEEPFYSSALLVDEMIGFIDSNLDDGQPFFSYLSFLAVHIPVQAPKEFTDPYLQTYSEGWYALRSARHDSAMRIGLVPDGSDRVDHDFIDDWDALSEEEQRFEAKRMAVYAGMVSAMDYNIGRLIGYLEEQGQLDNTVFIFTSDNGPEYNAQSEATMTSQGYTHDYEDLGEIGSLNFIGPNYAHAAASPLSYFKFHTAEGGLRVPLIISGPGVENRRDFTHASAHVIDIAPTILAMTNVEQPQDQNDRPARFGGRWIEPMTGKNLTPILKGTAEQVYHSNDYVGYEVAGNTALFNDRYKIVLNRGPLGDNEWYMFDTVNDPGETMDLKAQNPGQFQYMLNLYQSYTKENGVQSVPEHYTQEGEIGEKLIRQMMGDTLLTLILTVLTVGIFAVFGWQQRELNSRKQ
ncbi:MAG: arylsulfatase [Chloroflexota bacterium]